MLTKFVGTLKIVRVVRGITLLGMSLKKNVFQCLTKILNIGMLEIVINLKSELLQILNPECNFL